MPPRVSQTNLAYLLMLPVSSLAYNFRNTSKLPLHNATPFGGWETPYGPYGDDRGHFTGHYLSAAALMANATGNVELRSRSRQLVSALAECQAGNHLLNGCGLGIRGGWEVHLMFGCGLSM